jgi:hypothetical protein
MSSTARLPVPFVGHAPSLPCPRSLQYTQWYKVLAWLVVMVIGGSEGFLPPAVRDVFRLDELLLASEPRAQLFFFGQCVPFMLTKARHFLVTWAGSFSITRHIFYSIFTSHAEVACSLLCDSAVMVRPTSPSLPQPCRAPVVGPTAPALLPCRLTLASPSPSDPAPRRLDLDRV